MVSITRFKPSILQKYAWIYFILIVTVLCIFSCKMHDLSPSKYEQTQIRFGQGGGFSGVKTEFALLENGKMYKKMHQQDSFVHLHTFDKTFFTQMNQNMVQFDLDKNQVYEPGNLYYFIEKYDGSDTSRWVWGGSNYKASQNLVNYYNILFRTAKKLDK